MQRSNIEWTEFTSNPIRGKCLHACPYCYAERIRQRFGHPEEMSFHSDELFEVVKRKKPATIFMGSMYDLWGDWVPKGWLEEILNACSHAPQHTFLFLTKNPKRYGEFAFPENCWLGVTNDGTKMVPLCFRAKERTFFSFEPLLGNAGNMPGMLSGIIIGAQTGPGAVKPKREWVERLIDKAGPTRVFLKNNLLELFPDLPRRQETPWSL